MCRKQYFICARRCYQHPGVASAIDINWWRGIMSPGITALAPETLVLVVRTRNTRISKSRIRHPSALQNVPDKRRKTSLCSIPVIIVSSLCFIHVKKVIYYARPRKISFWAVCHMSAANSGSKVVNYGRAQHTTFDLQRRKLGNHGFKKNNWNIIRRLANIHYFIFMF